MPGIAGNLVIVYKADTGNFTAQTKAAAKQLGVFAQSATSAGKVARAQMADARGTVMVLGEEIGVHLPRHVQQFVAKLPGAQTALSAAFSATAVIAIGVAVFEAGKKIYEFAQKNEEAARKNASAWNSAIGSINQQNDSLELTKTKLENAIAKLEHKPENRLKEAIEEAKVAADELGRKLDEDVQKVADTLKGQEHNWFSQALLKQKGPNAAADISSDVQFKFSQIAAGTFKGGSGDDTADRAAVLRQAIGEAAAKLGPAQAILDQLTTNLGSKVPEASKEAVRSLTELIAGLKGEQQGLFTSVGIAQDQSRLAYLEGLRGDNPRSAAKAAPKDWKFLTAGPTEDVAAGLSWQRLLGSGAPMTPPGHESFSAFNDAETQKQNKEATELRGRAARDNFQAAMQEIEANERMREAWVKFEEESGKITKFAASMDFSEIHSEAFEQYRQAFTTATGGGALISGAEAARTTGGFQIQAAQDNATIRATTVVGQFEDKMRETVAQFTNLGDVLANFATHTLEGVNDTLMKMLSTPANEMRGKYPWRNLGASTAENAGGVALKFGEGEIMKAIFGRNPNAKLGTQSNPMWIKSADAAGGAALNGVLSKLFPGGGAGSAGAGNAAQSITSTGLGIAMSVAGLPHFATGGAIPADMPSIVGENGPEMFMPRNAGAIIPNGKFGGGGGDMHFHFDNRGAGDPAAVQAASERAVARAAPQMIAAARAHIQDRYARGPASRRF